MRPVPIREGCTRPELTAGVPVFVFWGVLLAAVWLLAALSGPFGAYGLLAAALFALVLWVSAALAIANDDQCFRTFSIWLRTRIMTRTLLPGRDGLIEYGTTSGERRGCVR